MSKRTCEHTKDDIKLAFYAELANNTPLLDLKVSKICETAGISRGTFYLYYSNIDELVREIVDAFFLELKDVTLNPNTKPRRGFSDNGNPMYWNCLSYLEFLEANRSRIIHFLLPEKEFYFDKKFYSFYLDLISDTYGLVQGELPYDKNLVILVTQSVVGTIEHWLIEQDMSVEDVFNIFLTYERFKYLKK